ncbi:MAG: HypC/HybG/HupF family hydrogenase formation chaperone [Gallionella sp.]|jgi:hydrogenase expression/formation protein HypC|nr:HypC/HybG/HupF family hydrogenase formation chaperone [Gallionella sp.]
MCLAIPARVVELLAEDQAIVAMDGVRKQISLALVDDVAVDDYVIVHVGFALSKVDQDEAEQTLAMFAQLGINDTSAT